MISRFRAFGLIGAASLFFMLPIILIGYVTDSHDAKHHVIWAEHFARVLWGGTLYPRWLPDMNGGLGSPTFLYYPPLPYYVAALFDFSPNSILPGTLQLRFAAPFFLIGSAFAFFWFLRGMVGRAAAVAGAIAYAAMPYHLFDLYIRGAFAEFAAFAIVPLVLVAIQTSIRAPLTGAVMTAVSFALLVLTHTLTAMACGPLFAAYAFFLFAEHKSLHALVATGFGAILGLALAGGFLLPALANQTDVVFPPTYIHPEFLLFGMQRADVPLVQIGLWILCTLSILAFTAAIIFGKRSVDASRKPPLMFWCIAGLSYCLFMTKITEPIWVHTPILAYLQYPYRLNVVVDISLAAIIAFYWDVLSNKRKVVAAIMCAVAGAASATAPIVMKHFGRDPAYWADALNCAGDYAQYRPLGAVKWSCGTRVSPLARPPSDKAWLANKGEAKVIKWASRSIDVDVDSPTPTTLYIGQFAYPGWTAFPENYVPLAEQHTDDGILAFAVPAGKNAIYIRLDAGPAEKLGGTISIFGFVAVSAMAACAVRYRRRRAANQPCGGRLSSAPRP